MKAKHLIVLVSLAAVLGGLAYLTSSKKSRLRAGAEAMGKHVFPQLQDSAAVNQVEHLAFETMGRTVNVARVDNVWVAPGKYNYPVDFEKVRDFVRKLTDLKVGQVVAPGQKQMEDLNLISPAEAESGKGGQTGTLVKLMDGKGKLLAELVVGKEHMKKPEPGSQFGRYGGYPDGRYVAAAGKAYLVAETLSSVPEDDKSWLDDDLLNISSSEILELSITGKDGQKLTLKRPDENGALAVADLTEDEEMETSKVNGLANLLSYLTFSDVVDPESTDVALGMDVPTVYVARTKKGKTCTLTIGGSPEGSKDRYLRLAAVYVPPEGEAPEGGAGEAAKDGGEEDEEALKKKEEQEKLALEVRDLNDRVAKWTYLVRSYKIDELTTDRNAVVKEKGKVGSSDDEEDKSEGIGGEESETPEKKSFLRRLLTGGKGKGKAMGSEDAETKAEDK